MFVLLLAAASCLYTGGMYLNDAFDAEYDRKHRGERPLPRGLISENALWAWGAGWMAAGVTAAFWLGQGGSTVSILLSLCILAYDAFHRKTRLAPVLMGVCRALLCLMAAASAGRGIDGLALWCALALGCYTAGLSCLARRDIAEALPLGVPVVLLSAPVVLAVIVNDGPVRPAALYFASLLAVWIIWSLGGWLRGGGTVRTRAVPNLLCGIALVDLLASVGAAPEIMLAFPVLFLAARVLQKYIPAD